MSAVAPTIPPRPTRAHQAAADRGVDKLPEIPPRPFSKRIERSVSPGHYPRSPLNEPFHPLLKSKSIDTTAQDVLPRRPSVQYLPSVGQEGMEYAEIQYQPENPSSLLGADAAAQTRNVAEDLQLHAPKPSLPKSSATAQVQAVTKTDPSQTASHGLNKPPTPGHDDHVSHDAMERVRSRASFSRPNSSTSGGRRASVVYGDEHGPAELGMRVPINPLLGDVQAPSPAPFTPNHTGQNGEPKRRHHFRTKSGRDAPPPGSYGLHGHGVAPSDPFEKEWYARHPEELLHEEAHGHGVYEGIGSGRGAFALSSDDLNKIVRNTASRDSAFGTSGNTPSYPDEQIGYLASAQYASPSAGPHTLHKTLTNASQPAMESPLREASLPAEDVDPVVQVRAKRSASQQSDDAVASGTEGQLHVDDPKYRYNKITGGEETIDETQDLKPYLTDEEDHGYSVPILAADEVAKRGDSEFLQPAVSPRFDRRSSQLESGEATPSNSRPSSRPGSVYGLHSASHSLSRFISHHDDRDTLHTPLEDVDEYEPLFPDEDGKQKALSHAERFRQRPDVLKHRFPSQDIWEDAPNSVMYQATVSTPDLPQTQDIKASAVFETPESEAARKGERPKLPADDFLTRSKAHLKDEMIRPGSHPRFPSSDIWEDSPESYHLVTTVSTPPVDAEPSVEALTKPAIPPRPAAKSRLGDGASSSQAPPSIPPRPPKTVHAVPPIDATLSDPISPPKQKSPTDLRKVPSIPDRPKPQIPPRPAKKTSGDSLTKMASTDSAESNETEKAVPVTSTPLNKVKPQVPARPAQAKFANLKGNFMNDLNQKLGLGPPKEKEKEPEPEPEPEAELGAKPLEDARKGRARGPQRRAPAKSPAAAPAVTFSISKPISLWNIDETGLLTVGSGEDVPEAKPSQELQDIVDSSAILSAEKVDQLDHATVADAPLPPTIDAESKSALEQQNQPNDYANALAPTLTTDTAGDYPDPTLGTPGTEKNNPLSSWTTAADPDLSQQSTESSDGLAKEPVSREVPNPNTDAIPASLQSTSSAVTGEPLEEFKSDQRLKVSNEQISTMESGAGVVGAGEVPEGGSAAEDKMQDAQFNAEKARGLEEVQVSADGKFTSDEELQKTVG